MNKYKTLLRIPLIALLLCASTFAQFYPDQHYVMDVDSIYNKIESSTGVQLSPDGKRIILQDGITEGSFILEPQYSQSPYNQGLPSWNGTAPDNNSSFKVQMRFPYGSSWSPWLTVGYWKSNIWSTYGTTSYGGGFVDVDYIKLNTYQGAWQFKVILTRTSALEPSPSIHKLSFFISDSRTTSSINYTPIVNDNPPPIFIPTEFVYQYGVDPQIGDRICSPTTVSMILKSYSINVDPYQFALATYDTYWDMFGVWPRVVQNASEYGVDGTVTRYRTWSETREVLANGGRIGMSIGLPLYSGHLVMLAGFTSDGRPIVHDPAKSNGYSYIYNKLQLSQSWFGKGGISYTFYYPDSITVNVENHDNIIVSELKLNQNYPNPFNPVTRISWQIPYESYQTLKIYDILGNEIATLLQESLPAGGYEIDFDASDLPSGIYVYRLQAGNYIETKKMILMK